MWLDQSLKKIIVSSKRKTLSVLLFYLQLASDNPHILLFFTQNQDLWLNLVGGFDYSCFVKIIISWHYPPNSLPFLCLVWTSEEICTLVIAEVFPEDSGSFTCTASNKYGTVSSIAVLRVKGKFVWN